MIDIEAEIAKTNLQTNDDESQEVQEIQETENTQEIQETENIELEPEEQVKENPRETAEYLQKRINAQVKRKREAEARANQLEQELIQARMLLAQSIPNSNQNYQPAIPDYQAQVQAQVQQELLNKEIFKIDNEGAKKFTDWQETVDTLKDYGLAGSGFVQAVSQVVSDPVGVLHYIGNNDDLAEKISLMSPLKQAAELARIETQINSKSKSVSKAPPVISPVSKAPVKGAVDLRKLAESDDSEAYFAARKKMGK